MMIWNEIICPQHPDNNVYRLVDSIMTDASVLRDFTQPDELSDLTLVIGGTPSMYTNSTWLSGLQCGARCSWRNAPAPRVYRKYQCRTKVYKKLQNCSIASTLHKNLYQVCVNLLCNKILKLNKFLGLRWVKEIQFTLFTLPYFHNKGKKKSIFFLNTGK